MESVKSGLSERTVAGFMGCSNGEVKVIHSQDPKAQRSGQAFDPCPTEAAGPPACDPREAAMPSLPIEPPRRHFCSPRLKENTKIRVADRD